MYVQKCLKLYLPNIKKTKKDYIKTIKLTKDIKIYLHKNKEKKSNNMVMNFIKISQKMKNKSLLSTEKIIIKWEKSNDLKILKVYIEIDKKLHIYFKKVDFNKKSEKL